jgi:hypothetical protein
MRDPIRSTLNAIERDRGGVAIVWCPDLGLRQWLVDEVESLVPSNRGAFRTTSLEDALAAPDRLALWMPEDETEAVLDLDGSRDRLRNEERPRTQPIVLFLLRHGDGADTLARLSTSLWSITGGSDVDPEDLTEIDLPAERQRFEAEHGRTPEAWLGDWRNDTMPLTSENIGISYQAKLLERT